MITEDTAIFFSLVLGIAVSYHFGKIITENTLLDFAKKVGSGLLFVFAIKVILSLIENIFYVL